MADPNFYDVIVLGGGGAGLMCAGVVGEYGKRTLVIDHAKQIGKKILISGGGRCNFTNRETPPERYLSANPHFAKSALRRYTPDDFIDLVNAYGIAWHEKTLGQLFCDTSAREIVDMLLAECAKGDVEVRSACTIFEVTKNGNVFAVTTSQGVFQAASLVLATGGPSIPKMGATGFAYDLGRQFGLKIVEPRPALVPLTLAGDEALFRDLSGVAAPTAVACGKARFEEATLFTHKGLSGPAVLQVSSYWRHGDAIAVNFFPDRAVGWLRQEKRNRPKTTLNTVLAEGLPTRLAEALCERLVATGPLGEMADKSVQAVETHLADWPFRPNGTEGYAKAEVTSGGVSTAELSSQTMEAKKVPGLYVIGEAVDVTGWLGGYNFQWAWSSGWAAGQAIGTT
ncbi:MAG: NAD(P)/FAD-dependent oxidoreductase [Pseudomonadota bacterium]